jgi:small subunit ribosomal protein S21
VYYCYHTVVRPVWGRLEGGRSRLKIEVFDNQIEPALKSLKREMLKGGVFKEMKRRAYYEKPSVKRKRKQAEARRKRLKAARRSRAPVD